MTDVATDETVERVMTSNALNVLSKYVNAVKVLQLHFLATIPGNFYTIWKHMRMCFLQDFFY